MSSYFWSFIRGIQNLWIWFPIIWKDRQYDHVYLGRILEKKLHLMADFFDSDKAFSAEAENVSIELHQLAKAFEDFDNRSLDDFPQLHEKYTSNRKIIDAFYESVGITDMFEELTYDRDKLPENIEKLEKENSEIYSYIDRMNSEDVKKAFLILSEKFEYYWD